jgi:uncharacterized Tic20 family protein
MDATHRTLTESEARAVAVLVHLGGIPFLFVPALVVFVLLEGRGGWLREQLRAALNFQLTMLAGYVIGFFTLWAIVGFVVLPVVAVLNVVLSILAAIAAYRGEPARYAVSLPFVP